MGGKWSTWLLGLWMVFLVIGASSEECWRGEDDGEWDGGEIFTGNVDHGGKLSRWFIHHEGMEERSNVLILAGNHLNHYGELMEHAGRINPHFHRCNNPKVLNLTVLKEKADLVMKQISTWIESTKSRDGEMPWSMVFITHADDLETFHVNEILQVFWNQRQCKSPEYGLMVQCTKLIIVLSTRFGAYNVIQPDSLDHAESRRDVLDSVYYQMRLKWSKGRIYEEHRHLTRVVFGAPHKDHIIKVIEMQRNLRATARQNRNRTPRQQDGIDPDFLDRVGFVGQKHVIRMVKRALESVRDGLKTDDGPLVFLFAGPAGTGKTYLSQLIARAYNGGEKLNIGELEAQKRFLHINMGNYQDERAVDGFVDPSPGLEGKGLLSELFQHELRTVVVLDEIEKAHPSLLKDMLLPVLDSNHGHVQKKKTGERFFTRDAIFILTTNCFDTEIQTLAQKMGPGLEDDPRKYGELVDIIRGRFQNQSANCLSSHRQAKNPFAWEPLWRRLKAGHSLATTQEMFVFLPSTTQDIDRLVEINLENLHDSYEKSQTSTIQGLYYSFRVQEFIKRRARENASLGNMAAVAAFVQSIVSEAISDAIKSAALEPDRKKVVVLFVSETQRLGAHVFLEDDLSSPSTWSTPREQSHERENTDLKQIMGSNHRDPINTVKLYAMKQHDRDEIGFQVKVEVEEREHVQAAKEEVISWHLNMSLDIDLDRLAGYLFYLTISLVFSYYFLLPLFKAVLAAFAILASMMLYFDPKLAFQLAKVVAQIAYTLGKLFISCPLQATASVVFILLFIIASRMVRARFFASNKQEIRVEQIIYRSRPRDISARWKLLAAQAMLKSLRRKLILRELAVMNIQHERDNDCSSTDISHGGEPQVQQPFHVKTSTDHDQLHQGTGTMENHGSFLAKSKGLPNDTNDRSVLSPKYE